MVTPKGLLLAISLGTYLRRRHEESPVSAARGVEALRHLVPVDDVPPRLEVVRALVLVLEVVGVLPDVDADQRRLARRDRRVLVGRAGDHEPRPVVHEPRPAAAELADARGVHLLLQLVEAAE